MRNSIVRRFGSFAATLDKLGKYFVIFNFAVQDLLGNTANIRQRKNFPFYSIKVSINRTYMGEFFLKIVNQFL